jgi:alpha-L-fucosidase
MNDTNRLKNIDNQHLFESFYNKFGKQLNSTIDVYSQITKHIDFLDSILCIEFPRLENLNAKDCYELQKQVKLNVENAFWLISAYNRTSNDNPHKKLLDEWTKKYFNFVKNKSGDLIVLDDVILKPFLCEIDNTSLINNSDFQKMVLLLIQARTVLTDELPYTFNEHKKNLFDIYQKAEKSIQALKTKAELL